MLEFLKYGLFYNRLTGGRIFIFTLFTLFSGACETLFVLSVLPIVDLQQEKHSAISSHVYAFLEKHGVTEPSEIMLCLIIFALACIVLAAIGIVATKVYLSWLQGFLLKKIQMETTPAIFRSDYGYLISKSAGYLNNAIIQQIPNTAFAFKNYATIIGGVIMTCVYMAVPVLKSPLTIVFLFLALSPAALILKFFNNKNRQYSHLNAKAFASFNGVLLQIIGSFKYLKATNTLEKAIDKMEKEVVNLANVLRRIVIWGGTCNDVIRPYAMLVILGTLYYTVSFQGASMVEAGTMFGLLYMAYQKSVVIPMAYQKFLSSSGAIKVYETITEELEKYPDPYNNKGKIAPDFTRPILIDDISFSYPNAETPTINKLAMTIPPRESIAIVGESGSGKSTLANILTALAKPQHGALSINGQTYDELDIPSLRSSIGYITQESVVFNDTVKNNITLWENNADMDKVMAAAKKAHAHDFIMDMPDGYDTMLGDDGVNISGGQRQRLTIARELYRDPPIIIFDEATSSLDSATEENIQREIDEMRGERTIVIIAHRLSTIRNCDTIFVMEKGEIVESGTYETLVSKKGKFHEMIKRQNLAGAE